MLFPVEIPPTLGAMTGYANVAFENPITIGPDDGLWINPELTVALIGHGAARPGADHCRMTRYDRRDGVMVEGESADYVLNGAVWDKVDHVGAPSH